MVARRVVSSFLLRPEPFAKIICADVLEGLRRLPAASVHCVVTSPPYWGLRDYGTGTWVGGDLACEHRQGHPGSNRADGVVEIVSPRNRDGAGAFGSVCRCGAVRIDSQIGLEGSPQAYVDRLVEVFREVRRVLRNDGTCWLNLGDSFSEKQLQGIPWRVAFALQADGWYLRQDIVWAKPNPMPESVTDRCTKAHEYIFLLTKNEKYYYDLVAISEEGGSDYDDPDPTAKAFAQQHKLRALKQVSRSSTLGAASTRRNKRSVWTVASQAFSEAHFATFPPALIEPCVLAGTSARGCCPNCGAPWRRMLERRATKIRRSERTHELGRTRSSETVEKPAQFRTVGWAPSCRCGADSTVPTVVLDPFGGAGTTALVASRCNRSAVLVDLSAEYCAMAARRLRDDAPFLAGRVEYV